MEKLNVNVMQYALSYWETLKNNNACHNVKDNEVLITNVSLTDHDILCRMFKYAVVKDDNDEACIIGYTNNIDTRLKIGECLVNTETREVVKDNRSY